MVNETRNQATDYEGLMEKDAWLTKHETKQQIISLFLSLSLSLSLSRVPRGSVVRCLTCNPGVLGSSCTRSSGFFRGSVLGQDTSEPSLVLVKPRKA